MQLPKGQSLIRARFEALGANPTYDNFIFFVKKYIAPNMQLDFVEEPKLKEMYTFILRNQYTAQQIHRGFGKSEMGIWLACFIVCCRPVNPFSGKPMIEGLIITSADDSLNTLAARIKHYFYENQYMRTLLPTVARDQKDDKKNSYWNKSEMYFRNGSIIHLRTIMSKSIRGNHVDWCWGDDLVGENSPLVDSKIHEVWFGAVDGTTTSKDALAFVTGTPKRLTDVMEKMNQSSGYEFRKYPIYNEEGKLISKRWNEKRAKETKERIGSVIFQCEYMLNPIDDSTSLIKRQWIIQCFSDKFKTNKLRPNWASAIYLGVDFAFSDRITADKSVYSVIAEYKKEDKKYYIVLDTIIKKGLSGMEQMEIIDNLHKSYKFDLIGLEENSIKAISKDIRKNYGHLPIKRFWTGTNDEKVEVSDTMKEFTTVGKRNLILRLGTCFENKEIIIPIGAEESKNNADQIVNECMTYAMEEGKLIEIGVHGDIPIALGYAIEVAKRWGAGFLLF